MSRLDEAIRIIEEVDNELAYIGKDELESRLLALENDARTLTNSIDVIRQAEVHQLDDQISSAVSEAESVADSIQSLYNDV